MPEIEHDPHEKRQTNAIWWIVWPIVGLLWAWLFYFLDPQWLQIGVGFLTGGILASWAIDITGNKVPPSWRG